MAFCVSWQVDEMYKWNAKTLGPFPWIFAGDLNCVPMTTAGCALPLVYAYMRTTGGLRSAYHSVIDFRPFATHMT